MAAGSTYTPIATSTLGSNTATVTFSSISGYTDLVMVFNGLVVQNSDAIWLQFNSDSSTNYSWTRLTGNGTTAASSRSSSTAGTSNWYGGSANGISNSSNSTVILQVFNYANSTTYKSWISRTASLGVECSQGLWRNTAAITSITLGVEGSRNYASGSTFTLYGIASAQPMPRGQFTKYAHCTIDDCTKEHRAKGMCQMHYRRDYLYGDPRVILNTGIKLDKVGYVQIRTMSGNANKGRYTYEHRLVMQEVLGRSLIKGETVHHKNGVRNDNRPENLELWSEAQPYGQRVEDKVAYAIEILEQYAPERLA